MGSEGSVHQKQWKLIKCVTTGPAVDPGALRWDLRDLDF